MLIGLITDTHIPGEQRELWHEVRAAFQGVDLILHGGDIVHPMVLDWLEEIAPVLAARGNNDRGLEDARIKNLQLLEHEGQVLAMMHDMEPERRPIHELCRIYLDGLQPEIIVTGHTHMERIDYRDGVLQINPGSPTLPHQKNHRLGTVGLLEWGAGRLEARIVRLGHTDGRPNPGIEYLFTPETGVLHLG